MRCQLRQKYVYILRVAFRVLLDQKLILLYTNFGSLKADPDDIIYGIPRQGREVPYVMSTSSFITRLENKYRRIERDMIVRKVTGK